MARKRMLSPEVFTSPTVASWPANTRWTWIGLLCYLDDHGYGENTASLVKAVVWPRDEDYATARVQADLDAIAAAGNLCLFECCGRPTMHIPTWSRWQKVAHPGAARFCPCPSHSRVVHESHMRDTRALHAGLAPIEVSSSEKSLRAGEPSDPTPEGSDGLAAAKAAFGKLGRASA